MKFEEYLRKVREVAGRFALRRTWYDTFVPSSAWVASLRLRSFPELARMERELSVALNEFIAAGIFAFP